MHRPRHRRIAILATICVALAINAQAQGTTAAAPARGLYGGRTATPSNGQTFDLNVSLFPAYTNVRLNSESPEMMPSFPGWTAQGLGAMRYRAAGKRATFETGAGSAWLQSLGQPSSSRAVGQYSALSKLEVTLWRGAQVRLGQVGARAPYYELIAIPQAAPADDLDPSRLAGQFSAAPLKTNSYRANGSFTQSIGRVTVYVEHERRQTMIVDRDTYDFQRTNGFVRLGLSRYFRVRAEYGDDRLRTRSSTAGIPHVYTATVAADLSRPLSLTRRTILDISLGSGASDTEHGRQFHATGSASLTRHIRRTWQAALLVDRQLEFLGTIAAPVLSLRTGMNVGGFIGRRTNVQALAGGAFGQILAANSTSRLNAYDGTLRVGIAASRHLTLLAEGSWRRYEFGNGLDRLAGLSSSEDTRIRIGLTLWAPLIGRR